VKNCLRERRLRQRDHHLGKLRRSGRARPRIPRNESERGAEDER